jgi:rubrerythrin
MWGELAAWEVASYLAENIRENTEAKMAATIQTFDEARHFYVLRDYLFEMNGRDADLPTTNSFTKSILMQILTTDSMVEKLIGMQLFVEHIAVHLFKHIAEVNVEPVLTDLLPYFHRDESRHVALGKLFLPEKFKELSPLEAARLHAYQLWLTAFMGLSIEYYQKDADILGLDTRTAMMRAMRDQTHMIDTMGKMAERKGAFVLPKQLRFINRYMLQNYFPDENQEQPLVFKYFRPFMNKFAVSAERVWAVVA